MDWEKLLRIKTTGRDDSFADRYHHPYEPTPYSVLERLAKSGYIGKKNVLVDYGCGKGRVEFFLSYETRCSSIGIEYDKRMYEMAQENAKTAVSGVRTQFLWQSAESYVVPTQVDRFYFFNPFSEEIMQKVMHRIRESYYESPREMLLFFYYPSYEYMTYLLGCDELSFVDEISCEDLFDGADLRETILVFECV